MEALKFELSQLKAQLQPPPRPQISSNEVVERYPPLSAEREAMPENSSWQPVGKKRRPRKRQRSTKQGATESTEARASPTVSLVTSNVSDKLEGKAKVVGARSYSMGNTESMYCGYSEICHLEVLFQYHR